MRTYNLRKDAQEKLLFGMWVTINAPDLIEQLGVTGYDLLCIDAEHSAFDLADIAGLIRASDMAGLPTIVRIAELGPDVSRVLDLGAAGVMVPRINSAAEAREVVARARFSPAGSRGVGASRAAAYGTDITHYLARANEDLMVLVQVESLEGLSAVDEIAQVDGVDAIFIGPADLAHSLSTAIGSAEYESAVQTVFAAGRRHGRAVGIACLTAANVEAARRSGASIILFGHDRSFVLQGATATMRSTSCIDQSAGE